MWISSTEYPGTSSSATTAGSSPTICGSVTIEDGAWRTFGLRKDFYPASKLPVEDDITASITVPRSSLENLDPDYQNPSLKFVKNCEQRLFQRPDDAIHPGYDKQTEADFAKPGNFFSNYEALTAADAKDLMEDTIGFDQFTLPMQQLIRESATGSQRNLFCFVGQSANRGW